MSLGKPKVQSGHTQLIKRTCCHNVAVQVQGHVGLVLMFGQWVSLVCRVTGWCMDSSSSTPLHWTTHYCKGWLLHWQDLQSDKQKALEMDLFGHKSEWTVCGVHGSGLCLTNQSNQRDRSYVKTREEAPSGDKDRCYKDSSLSYGARELPACKLPPRQKQQGSQPTPRVSDASFSSHCPTVQFCARL